MTGDALPQKSYCAVSLVSAAVRLTQCSHGSDWCALVNKQGASNVRQILLAVSTAMAVALAVAVSLLGAGAPAAQAGVEWCEFDPLVMIHTPGGHHVPLHVTTYAEGPQHA